MSETQEIKSKCGRVAILGRPNVGKSTLLNAYIGEKIAATTHKPQTTQRQLQGFYTHQETQIIFVDTPGLHKHKGKLHAFMMEEALSTLEEVDVLVLLVESFQYRKDGVQYLEIDRRDKIAYESLAERINGRLPLILAINKIDKFQDKEKIINLLQEWSTLGEFSEIVPVSAMKRQGLKPLREAIKKYLPDGEHQHSSEQMTDSSEKKIVSELIREKAMLELDQEMPYKVAVLVDIFDESRRDDPRKPIVHIEAIIHTERESQKRTVIGKGASKIKVIGERARKDIEHLLGCQVMLKLFVKVESNWTETEKGLARVGYKR